MTKGTWNRTTKAVADAQPLSPRMNFTNAATSSGDEINRLMPAKCAFTEVLNQGLEASASASNMNGAPDLRRALSLLSSDAWVPSSTAQGNEVHLAGSSNIAASPFQVVPSAPESWQEDHTLTFNFHGSGSQSQELHFSKVPYDSSIFEANEVL
ncbi:hypothetical protein HPP92_014773 [Vanilla planifolia]|uniref:Uncharacterized protein n=1 Tax=Vanilla planifolia TaxID=51239 RepID=A0A835UV29_VANPL|nr:hypothetical protein HPP92_014773 [Vanilla planifolia]